MDQPSLTTTDLHFVCSRVPRDVRDLAKERDLRIAGGYIRAVIAGEKPSDIDMFGSSKEQLTEAAKDLALKRRGRVHETDNALTVLAPPRYPVQFITRWVHENPADLLRSFDFSIAQTVLWFNLGAWRSMVGERFYSDLAAKRLYYTAPERNEDAGGSLMRMIKFTKRGYNIQAPSIAAVIVRLLRGVREDSPFWEASEAQRADVLTGLIREVDPLLVVDGVDLVDEHAVPT